MSRLCPPALLLLAYAGTLLATGPRSRVEVTTSETIAYSPEGTIRIDDSFGRLRVEGWDRDVVELKLTRRTNCRYEEEAQRAPSAPPNGPETRWLALRAAAPFCACYSDDEWKARRRLEKITVEITRWNRDLHIATHFPDPSLFYPLGGRSNLNLDYRLMVPRKAQLQIRHSVGQVDVSGVSGEMDVSNKVGEVVLRLPDGGEYNIRAQADVGDVDSDFHGRSRRSHLVGATFDMPDRHGGKHVRASVGIGEVKIVRSGFSH